MENQERIEPDAMKISDGKDELNLAEFPLCALAHRLRPEEKTLHFEDQLWDESRRETITRQLIITGSDAYGLPTALDDEVILGLIQLTKLQQFADRKVHFTRYWLLQLLGWRDDTKSYERLDASLNRWTGVTLYYRNAWWNKTKRCWVDEKFHVLDNVWLCHRSGRTVAPAEIEGGAPRSAFVWNEVVFRSFQAGNLKSIDFDFYKALKSAIARRLYRFLDKRFFHRPHWEFNLKEFGWEHAGLARCYDSAGLKRKLCPGIAELEEKGYLQRMPEEARFRKVCSGEWRVVFERAGSEAAETDLPAESPEVEGLAGALAERGVTPATARETVRKHSAEQIKRQIEVFDWLVERQDAKVSRNPPGFLISAIRGEYIPPRDFVSSEELATRVKRTAERKRRGEDRQREREAAEAAKEQEREKLAREYWASQSYEVRTRMEAEALSQASAFQRQCLSRPGSLGEATRKAILEAYALNLMKTGA